MQPIDIAKGIGGLLFTGLVVILMTFINFVLRKHNASLMGAVVPAAQIHAVLGPLLILINAALLIFLCAMLRTDPSPNELAEIQHLQVKWVLGPLLNPYFHGASAVANAVGYGFMIVLWWLGMHSFTYSLGLSNGSPWLFGWQCMVSVVYLALGLASMLAIQGAWAKWGMDAYRLKWICGFIGIGVGAMLPPVILKLGLPKLFGS